MKSRLSSEYKAPNGESKKKSYLPVSNPMVIIEHMDLSFQAKPTLKSRTKVATIIQEEHRRICPSKSLLETQLGKDLLSYLALPQAPCPLLSTVSSSASLPPQIICDTCKGTESCIHLKLQRYIACSLSFILAMKNLKVNCDTYP